MYCMNCGKEIAEGSRFCMYCGSPVEIIPAEPVKKEIITETPEPLEGDILKT